MTQKKHSRAQLKKLRARRRRQRRMAIAAAVIAVALIVLAALLLRRPGVEAPAVPAPVATAVPTDAPEPMPEVTDTPAPTPLPDTYPNVVSFYRPEGKPYSPRVRMGDGYSAKWKKGEDIGSFEVIASNEERLEGDFFADIFGAAWKAFPDADRCHIGYQLRYTLEDASEIKYTMLSPEHVEHTEYIECWLYDDYHREPHKSYSHIKSMKEGTLITSIKLTCGRKIAQVREIWLSAFIWTSPDEFDGSRNYTGDVSCTLHITRG